MESLSAQAVAGVTGSVLSKNFDSPQPTPSFHHRIWEMACSDYKYVAIAAPRGHSKSTSVTVCYTLCEAMFRQSSFILIVSATESNAAGFLDLIKRECTENEDLIELFGIDELEKDSYTDIIIRFKDGEKFRILAKGAEQKLRGLLWRGKRPDLVICHEKGTQIKIDGQWMRNDEHPTAREFKSDGFEIDFGGFKERVTTEHRYWVKGQGWVEAKNLKPGMLVGEPNCLVRLVQSVKINLNRSNGIRKLAQTFVQSVITFLKTLVEGKPVKRSIIALRKLGRVGESG